LELRRDDGVGFDHVPRVDTDTLGDFVDGGLVLELGDAVSSHIWGHVEVRVGESLINPLFSDFLVENLLYITCKCDILAIHEGTTM